MSMPVLLWVHVVELLESPLNHHQKVNVKLKVACSLEFVIGFVQKPSLID